MILGIILRNYKCYKGLHYIPLYKNEEQKLNIFIGDNGVGKSTILEGLDSLFNDAGWVINSDSYAKEAYVGIVLLVEKSICNDVLKDSKEKEIFSTISNAFWNVDITSNSVFSLNYQELFQQRLSLADKKETHYLCVIGKKCEEHNLSLLSFEKSVENYLEELNPKPNTNTIGTILSKILNIYSYLYIPVETTISEFLKLETLGMQVLADRNLKNTISQALNEKRITRTNDKNNRTKRLSIIDIINEQLEAYITQIQTSIQKIDSSYDFNLERGQSKNLTPNHIANVIIETYYSKRKLKKNRKPIATLSSGEKRRALIDIIHVFLSKNSIERNLILAIDEPESSLHISKCYDQFQKIQDIALVHQQQLFITTHWYGSLPILTAGNLIHIQSNQQVSLFNITNFFEDRRAYPDDINLKSFFDLSAAIISAYRNNKYHWLLVEGTEDMLYLQYYLDMPNIRILPLCGCGNVKKIYEYLYTPMSLGKKELAQQDSCKILSIIDTDMLSTQLDLPSETKNKLLFIRRWHENTNTHQVELKTVENPSRYPTEIEDILEPQLFYETLKDCIYTLGTNDEKEAFNAFEYDSSVKISRIRGDYSILNHLGGGRSMRADKEIVCHFVDRNKLQIAQKYTKFPRTTNIPKWVQDILDILIN